MSPENFCYWLQGLFEDGKVKTLDAAQVKMVKTHLGYVFEHPSAVAPAVSGPAPATTVPLTPKREKELRKAMEDMRDKIAQQTPPWGGRVC